MTEHHHVIANYTNEDNGVWLECACLWRKNMGQRPTIGDLTMTAAEHMQRTYEGAPKPVVADHAHPTLAELIDLLASVTDTDDCSRDHHGGCQTHGFLSLEQGESCPQWEAQEILRLAGAL